MLSLTNTTSSRPSSTLYSSNMDFIEESNMYGCQMPNMSTMSSSSSPSGDSQDSTMSLPASPPMSVTLSPQSMQNLFTMTLEEQVYNNIDMLYSKPHLVIREQPIEKFRFRYKSEMMGTHGSIIGRSSDKTRKKYFPAVELINFGGTAIIRCSLYTAHADEKERTLHTHRLVVKVGAVEQDDPHQITVDANAGYIAVFQGMGIIHTARKHTIDELTRKKRFRLLEHMRAKNINLTCLSQKDETNIRAEADLDARTMDLNMVTLGFQAFVPNSNGTLIPICDPVFSDTISNMKSALTGELKICRVDRHVSSCSGGDEVFMLVEKVGKKNIKVRFFETDDDDNEIWEDYGRFTELDVHHQYAIVLRTPPYRHTDIVEPVQVLVQLYRPTDGRCSESIKFTYKPSEQCHGMSRKRQRTADDAPLPVSVANPAETGFNFTSTHFSDAQFKTNNGVNPMLPQDCFDPDLLLDVDLPSVNSLTLEQALNDGSSDDLTSAEFREFMQNLSVEGYLRTYSGSALNDMDIVTDCDQSSKSTQAPGGGVSARGEAAPVPAAPVRKSPPALTAEARAKADDDLLKSVVNTLILLMKRTPLPSASVFAVQIRTLFDKKTDDGDCALHLAVKPQYKIYLDKILTILTHGRAVRSETLQNYLSDVLNSRNNNLETPLNRAVVYNQPKTVAALLLGGACPNLTDIHGYTPLHVAVIRSHNDCLAELLNKENYKQSSRQMYLGIKSEDGCSPLHIATRKKNLAAVKLLVEAGAMINEKDQTNGRTALHIAVEEESAEILSFLVQRPDVLVDEPNFAGNTALHMACVAGDTGSIELCNILLKAKANPRIANYYTDEGNEEETEDSLLDTEEVTVKQEHKEEFDEVLGSIGQTAFDLASDKTKILGLLQESVLTSQEIKKETDDSIGHIGDEPSSSGAGTSSPLFDSKTLSSLCDILDRTSGWKPLAKLMDFDFLLASIDSKSSPSKLLFNYADIYRTVTVHQIREFLVTLREHEAIKVIDDMLPKNLTKSS